MQFDEQSTLDISFIRFNSEEFNELVSNYNLCEESIPISKGWLFLRVDAHMFSATIYRFTKGHPGLTRKTLNLISDEFRKSGIFTQSDDDIYQYLLTRDYKSAISSTRAVPSGSFNDIDKNLLRDVVYTDKIPEPDCDEEVEAAMVLVRSGPLVAYSFAYYSRGSCADWRLFGVPCTVNPNYLHDTAVYRQTTSQQIRTSRGLLGGLCSTI